MATRSTMIPRSTIARSASGDSLKDKKGTSPSNSHTIQRSTSAKEAAAEKHIPNYLKPTESFKLNHVKKSSGSGNGNNNQNDSSASQKLLRRRSFDKPPASSPRAHKALISPPAGPRDRTLPLHPKERTIPVRSSSFSGRSTTSTSSTTISSKVPVLDRSATSIPSRSSLDGRSSCNVAPRTPKAVKPQPGFTSRTTKKNAKTKEEGTSSTTSSSTKTLNQEAKQEEEKDCPNHEVVEEKVEEGEIEEVRDDHNTETMPISECNEEKDVDDDHQNDHHNSNTSEVSTISTVSEGENVMNNGAAQVEEGAQKVEENPKEINVVAAEADQHHHHEEEEEKGGEETSNDDDHHEIVDDENKVEGIKADDGLEEEEEEEVVAVEAGNRNLAANRREAVQGKKESPTAYNDVIEETASKLLEKRKNKVKALVGAFETVIDYESGASK